MINNICIKRFSLFGEKWFSGKQPKLIYEILCSSWAPLRLASIKSEFKKIVLVKSARRHGSIRKFVQTPLILPFTNQARREKTVRLRHFPLFCRQQPHTIHIKLTSHKPEHLLWLVSRLARTTLSLLRLPIKVSITLTTIHFCKHGGCKGKESSKRYSNEVFSTGLLFRKKTRAKTNDRKLYPVVVTAV